MEIRLDELAEMVGGTLHGDGSCLCTGANPPGQCDEQEITLIVDPNTEPREGPPVCAAIVTPKVISWSDKPQIVVAEPHHAFARVVARFRPPAATRLPGVGVDSKARIASSAKLHPTATVCENATIGERTVLMPGVVVMEHCHIGDDCVLYPGVTLYPYSELGDRVVIHANSTMGANGFGYRQQGGRHVPQSQLGFVRIEADVEIGASVTIDRGTYGATRIGEGTKIDNQVMIAHNCQIGRHNLICSQVGIAGSCRTGDYVILAGQVGLKDHITLGDHAIVGAKAGVMDNCAGDQVYLGSPAMPQRDQMQIFALQRKLPDMRRELKALRRQLDALTHQINTAPHDSSERAA